MLPGGPLAVNNLLLGRHCALELASPSLPVRQQPARASTACAHKVVTDDPPPHPFSK